ncbi:hypothetical protein Q3A90_23430 [Priestia megaterium]|uniref:hypothetical protein n=1 Tax=Priestia megaterium TaxID=1404 RepID=UPI002674DA4A|nr:hypothetical protein [Priestia megaterium]WKU22696.1 hypothetical protein Q3A90_23430 [Priestia megaterium]
MITALGTGLVFFSLVLAEKKGLLDPKKAETIIKAGMMVGICGAFLYFIHTLSSFF